MHESIDVILRYNVVDINVPCRVTILLIFPRIGKVYWNEPKTMAFAPLVRGAANIRKLSGEAIPAKYETK